MRRTYRRRCCQSHVAPAPLWGDEFLLLATASASPATGIEDDDLEARVQGGQEVRKKRSGGLAANLAPAGLAACSSSGEGREGGSAEAFCGGGMEPPMSPHREERYGSVFKNSLSSVDVFMLIQLTKQI